MQRSASAVWHDSLKHGHGSVSSNSHTLKDVPFSFHTRFADAPGTNPEELLAAAHASCFSMAFAAELANLGFDASQIETTATYNLDRKEGQWSIGEVHLSTQAVVRGIDGRTFQDAANKAKTNCPVSKLVKANIVINCSLVEEHAA